MSSYSFTVFSIVNSEIQYFPKLPLAFYLLEVLTWQCTFFNVSWENRMKNHFLLESISLNCTLSPLHLAMLNWICMHILNFWKKLVKWHWDSNHSVTIKIKMNGGMIFLTSFNVSFWSRPFAESRYFFLKLKKNIYQN